MLDDDTTTNSTSTGTDSPDAPDSAPAAKKAAAKKSTAKKTTTKSTAAKSTAKKAPAKKAAAESEQSTDGAAPAAKKTAPKKKAAAKPKADATDAKSSGGEAPASKQAPAATALLFQAPEPTTAPAKKATQKQAPKQTETDEKPAQKTTQKSAQKSTQKSGQSGQKSGPKGGQQKPKDEDAGAADAKSSDESTESSDDDDDTEGGGDGAARRRRRRGGRRRRKPGTGEGADGDEFEDDDEGDDDTDGDAEGGGGAGTRRRRVRVRDGEGAQVSDDPNTVTRVRKARSPEDEITAVSGSTRLEAKKQRRREGREAGRRRAPIVSEAEFLARREAVDRVMVIRQREDLTQIAVLEDKVLVEHYVARESQTSLIGNVYLGRVQNVLPSMEAAFIDIGKGRNAVLYAGEVNWSALGHPDGQPRKIESVLSSGQSVLVQVTKDPVGHKGARLTSQVSLAGRFLVYVPDGTTSGISRKLPDTERSRLKTLLKEIVPDTAGVIVRTAAEGASEDELTRDVERLKARWEDIEKGAKSGNGPKLLYGEPDLTLKVVRDLFTEDFNKLVIQGDEAWETVQAYVEHVAPDLKDRLEEYEPGESGGDVFSTYRIDEQIAKGVDRKVWLPSGGSLIIDRTEAMTVVDVNTGKFTGSGGNLEETVTKNNLEAAEEIVRQLRLRDIGGIIVVDFIDMVLESNRDLVLRRLVECLGRDRTRHQVAEVTSLGLVQMTRKRIGTGLLEAFSENCEHCGGRGLLVHDMPVEAKKSDDSGDRRGGSRRSRGGRGGSAGSGSGGSGGGTSAKAGPPSPKDVAAVAKPENAEKPALDEADEIDEPLEPLDAPEETVVEETEAAPEADEPQAQEPEEPAEEEPAAQVPVETAPKVVTRTRRAVSRPAGATAATSEPVAIVVPETVSTPDEPVVAAAAPKVVTRTRQAATRPSAAAGEPATVAAPVATLEPPAEEHADDQPHPELHVPIKKKGSRKR